MNNHGSPVLVALQTAFVLSWSSGWILAQFAIQYAETPLILCVRFLTAAALTGLYLSLHRLALSRQPVEKSLMPCPSHRPFGISWRQFRQASLIGLLSQAVWLWAVIEAQRYGVSPGVNALINGTQPLITAALLPLVLKQRPPAGVVTGIMIAFGGLILVVWDGLRLSEAPVWAYGIPLISVASMTSAVMLRRLGVVDTDDRAVTETVPDEVVPDRVRLLFVQFLASGVVTLIWVLIAGPGDVLWGPEFVIIMVWIVILPQITSYALLWYLVDRTSPVRASALFLASPAATALLSFIIFREPITALEGLGGGIVLAGLYLGLRPE